MDKLYQIITEVNKIINPAYLVGGSVRDHLMGKEPKDYDFTTPMLPDDIEAKIRNAGRRPYLIGKKFGTIGFKVEIDGKFEYVEVTTFRKETYEKNNRKPKVEFVNDLKEDLSRRDFTINAISLNPDFYIIDPFNGQGDLLKGIIKCVGRPDDRFREDPLRILRAIRFAGKYGFAIEKKTLASLYANQNRLLTISKERWMEELDKIFSFKDKDFIDAMNLLISTEHNSNSILSINSNSILSIMIFELKDFIRENDMFIPVDTILSAISSCVLEKKWAILFKELEDFNGIEGQAIELVNKYGQYLKWSNKRVADIKMFINKVKI